MSLRTHFYGSALYHLSLSSSVPAELAVRLDQPWPGDAVRGSVLLGGEFRFAGDTVRGETAPWGGDHPAAWRAELHRFGWLSDLAALGSEEAWQAARAWTAAWLERCGIYESVSWRADVIGDRLFVWIEHLERLAGATEQAELRQKLLRSMTRQTRHLYRTALREAVGLPRLKALRGLVAATAALKQTGRMGRAVARLGREADAQILADGGHVARSPAAQLQALICLIDARAALMEAAHEVPATIQQAIDRAAPILRFFRHGDGRFALFNGANEDQVATIDLVLARADAKGRAPLSAPHLGFQRMQAGRSYVLMDCGLPPRRGLDADAHAGTLAFEMSHGRERLIVNCGAYHGPSQEWRLVTRATAAHSTLIVGDTNSAEIKPDGSLGRGPNNVTMERAEDEGSQWVAATHDGYGALFGLTHARQLFLAADGEDLRGEDRLTGRAGHGFVLRFHLHPTVQASLSQDGNGVLLRVPSGAGWRLKAQGAVLSLGESVYLGQGDMRKTQQIILDGHVGSSGATVRWAIRRETKKMAEAAEVGDEAEAG
jgi:uncharacterized heparinase superfamily protein